MDYNLQVTIGVSKYFNKYFKMSRIQTFSQCELPHQHLLIGSLQHFIGSMTSPSKEYSRSQFKKKIFVGFYFQNNKKLFCLQKEISKLKFAGIFYA